MKQVLSNVFELHFGGKLGIGETRLGDYYGDILQDKVPEFLIKVAKAVEAKNSTFEEWIKDNSEEFKAIVEEYNVQLLTKYLQNPKKLNK